MTRVRTGNVTREPDRFDMATPVDVATPGEVATPRGSVTPSEIPSSASWSSTNPGTATSLRALIFGGLNARKHTFAEYEALLRKQVNAL